MGIMATGVRINTTQSMILYRGCVIEETDEGWEWSHEDYRSGVTIPMHKSLMSGTCDTIFEAIEAVEKWHGENE